MIEDFICLESPEELKIKAVFRARILTSLRLPRLKKFQVADSQAKTVDLLPADAHLFLSETTRTMYSCLKLNSRRVIFGGDGFRVSPENKIVEPPVAAFQLRGWAMWFVNLISRALDGEGIPCPSLREIGSDSQQTLKSLAEGSCWSGIGFDWSERTGNRIRI